MRTTRVAAQAVPPGTHPMPIYAVVLTSPPHAPSLSEFAVERAWSLIPEAQRRTQEWLAPREAWQGEFATNEVGAADRIRSEVGAALYGLAVDANIVIADPTTRRKKLLVADMESTVIEQECLDELADHLGLRARIAALTEQAMRGEVDFRAALIERVALLAGLEERALDEVWRTRITETPGARTLVATMKRNGAHAALVSGGFTFFTDRVAKAMGFDDAQANVLETEGGRLAGRVREPVLGREAKLAALERRMRELKLDPALTIAVGDGANDLDMLEAAGLGVAFRAKPVVAARADAAITHGDLTALLYLQGYRRAEFAD
jgi:phosphoserine phosphatase